MGMHLHVEDSIGFRFFSDVCKHLGLTVPTVDEDAYCAKIDYVLCHEYDMYFQNNIWPRIKNKNFLEVSLTNAERTLMDVIRTWRENSWDTSSKAGIDPQDPEFEDFEKTFVLYFG